MHLTEVRAEVRTELEVRKEHLGLRKVHLGLLKVHLTLHRTYFAKLWTGLSIEVSLINSPWTGQCPPYDLLRGYPYGAPGL